MTVSGRPVGAVALAHCVWAADITSVPLGSLSGLSCLSSDDLAGPWSLGLGIPRHCSHPTGTPNPGKDVQ